MPNLLFEATAFGRASTPTLGIATQSHGSPRRSRREHLAAHEPNGQARVLGCRGYRVLVDCLALVRSVVVRLAPAIGSSSLCEVLSAAQPNPSLHPTCYGWLRQPTQAGELKR
jgi:hypothetical protein